MKKKSKLISGVALCIAGIVLLAGCVYFFIDTIEFFKHSNQAEGIIVDVESSRRNNSTFYHPVITFQAFDGNTYTFTSKTGTNAALDFNSGDKLVVRYSEESPQNAKIDGLLSLWVLPLALLVTGVVLGLSGSGIIYKHFKKFEFKRIDLN